MFDNYKQQVNAIVRDMQVHPSGVAIKTALDILEHINPNDTPIQNILCDAVCCIKNGRYRTRFVTNFLWGVVQIWDLVFMDPETDLRKALERLDPRRLEIFAEHARTILWTEPRQFANLSKASVLLMLHNELQVTHFSDATAGKTNEKPGASAASDSDPVRQTMSANKTIHSTRATVRRKTLNGNSSGTRPSPLKKYRVGVAQTRYGEVVVEARNEEEALQIAQGYRKMYNGDCATEHFQPMSSDTYLTLCEDENGATIKEYK